MKPLTFVLAVVLLTGLAVAEDKLPEKFVRVLGTAEVKTAPDLVIVELGVEKQDPSAVMAKKAADLAVRKVLASLHANGINDRDIQTTYLSLQPRSEYRKKVKISYFMASQSLSVTVRDLSKLDTLLESLVKAGSNRIDSISYDTSEPRKYRDQARDLAVKAAREKAEALAKAMGQDIGKAHAIEEVPDSAGYAVQANAYAYYRGQAAPSTAPGQIKISASVTVTFDLN